MPTARINEVDLYYERAGEGPEVLFVNGSGATLETAAPILSRLRNDLDVLAFDARGLGRSGAVAGPYAMADLARDVLGLLDHVGWTTCRMVGISFGGMLAQEVAVTAPERFERLVLLCTSAGGAGGSSYPLHELASLSEAERNAISMKIVDSRYSPEWLADHPLDQALLRVRAESASRPRSDAELQGAHEQLMARKNHDVSARLDRISCPTLVAYGEYDGIAPKANSAYIADHIENAELRGYEGGHLFIVQDPAALPDVIGFLAQA